MTQKLIIIRGNAGSGKSTIASKVRSYLGDKVLFLQQDVLRRDILKWEDKEGDPVLRLIEHLVLFGKAHHYDIVLEGILSNDKYGALLRKLAAEFSEAYIYYLDIPFEETLRRHSLRSKRDDFGEHEMKEWWKEKDYLGIKGERLLDETHTEDELVAAILHDIGLG